MQSTFYSAQVTSSYLFFHYSHLFHFFTYSFDGLFASLESQVSGNVTPRVPSVIYFYSAIPVPSPMPSSTPSYPYLQPYTRHDTYSYPLHVFLTPFLFSTFPHYTPHPLPLFHKMRLQRSASVVVCRHWNIGAEVRSVRQCM